MSSDPLNYSVEDVRQEIERDGELSDLAVKTLTWSIGSGTAEQVRKLVSEEEYGTAAEHIQTRYQGE